MERNIDELKEALERIEEKLISAEKVYSAMQFQIWLVAMILYYLIISPFRYVPWQLTATYWILAFIVFAYFSSRILKRLINLLGSYGKDMKSSPAFGMGIALSWTCGLVIGWVLVPKAISGVMELHQSIAVGFLSFISISVFGMFVTFLYFAKSFEREMIPAFLIPALTIPTIGSIQVPTIGNIPTSVVYAGLSVGLAFSLTVLAYLISAFRVIR
jgi:hypothetical protein